jgi:hypothetical protein
VAAIAGAVDPVETVEDPFLVLGGNSQAGAADAQQELVAAAPKLELNRAARGRVAD